jgi:hypothetical protein
VFVSSSRLALCLLAFAAQAAFADPAIQYAEPVALSLKSSATQFDAYGRRFELTLADNDRVLRKLPGARKAELAPYRLVRGTVDGSPGSWVRLVQSAQGVEGAIWDGRELYAVTRYDRVAGALTTPLDAAPGQTVVYRLSDVRDALPRDFCASDAIPVEAQADAPVTGLDQYRAVVQELEVEFQASSVTRQLEISLIGDGALQAAETDPTAAMLARLSIVEGIFSEQLGLLILATDVRLTPAGADPFTSTKGGTMLDQLASYRAANADVRARGIAHLVTGKDLDGSTAGIAYVGTVCSAERGVSLSMSSYGTTISSLVMAHEIGHNLGANHDGEAGTACAGVGGGFIMAPAISGFATFSSCSLGVIQQTLASASCVTPAEFADVALETGTARVTGEGGVPFTLPFVVKSGGNLDAENVVATITLPALAGYAIESAASSAGACAVSGTVATCNLGAMPVAAQHTITVNARGTTAQNFNAQARVESANDRVTSNNSRQLPVSIRSGIDAAVTLSASAGEADLGAPVEVYADVTSLRAMALTNATLAVNFNQPVSAASMPGANCTASAFAVTCTIASLPAGETRRVTVTSTASVAGPMFAGASINITGDGDFANNTANVTGWVRAPHDVELTAGPPVIDLGVGAAYEIPFTLRSRGSSGAAHTRLTIRLLSTALAVDAADAACVPTDATTYACEIGPLAGGEARLVRLRVHGTRAAAADVSAVAVTDDDGYTANDTAGVQLRLENAVDLAVTLASGGAGVEDQSIPGQVTVRSNGRETLTGAVLDIDLNAAGTIEQASIHNGAACTLVSPQRARCTLPTLAKGAQVYVDWQVRFAEPGNYDVTFTARAAGDSAADNDVLERPVVVRPWNDASIVGTFGFTSVMVGETRASTFTVVADHRLLAAARFVAPNALPGLRVTDITSSAGDCRVDTDSGGSCDFANLAPGGSAAVTVTWTAEESVAAADLSVSVSTAGDIDSGNDAVRTRVQTYGMTDLDLRVGPAVSGFRNTTVAFPEITLVNGNDKAVGASLEVTLPAGMTLADVSAANAICSGTDVLRCDFDDLDAGSLSTVNLSVHASQSGTFNAALRLTAANDGNAGNDSRDVEVTISNVANASQTAGGGNSPGSGGGGGGGRMEWLALACLALLVAARVRNRWRAVGATDGMHRTRP